jgi:hypothetical protein
MSFKILRMMAQEYADRHKEPLPLPATIDTMAYAYQRICQGEDPWSALGIFLTHGMATASTSVPN